MMSSPRITLDQWAAFAAVVEAGSYAKAADRLHKSQSSVTYAVQQIESQLGVEAFRIAGRKAVLTPSGELLYRRARFLLDEAAVLQMARGVAVLGLALAEREGHAAGVRRGRGGWAPAAAGGRPVRRHGRSR